MHRVESVYHYKTMPMRARSSRRILFFSVSCDEGVSCPRGMETFAKKMIETSDLEDSNFDSTRETVCVALHKNHLRRAFEDHDDR